MKDKYLEKVLKQINEDRDSVRNRESSEIEALALIYIRLGEFLHAEQCLSELRDVRTDSEYSKYDLRRKIAHVEYLLGNNAEAIAHFNEVENNLHEVGIIYHDLLLMQLLASKAKLLGLDSVSTDLNRLEPSMRISALTTAAESELYDWNRHNAKILITHAKTILTELDEEERKKASIQLGRMYLRATVAQENDGEDLLIEVRKKWQAGDLNEARAALLHFQEMLDANRLTTEQIIQLATVAYLLDEKMVFEHALNAYEATLPPLTAQIISTNGIVHSLVTWGEVDKAFSYIDGIGDSDKRVAARIMLARVLAYANQPEGVAITSGLCGSMAFTRLSGESGRTEIVLRDLNTFQEKVLPGGADEGYENAICDAEDNWTLLDAVPGKRRLLAQIFRCLVEIDCETGKVMPFSPLNENEFAVYQAQYSPDGSKLALIGTALIANEDDIIEAGNHIYIYSLDVDELHQLVEVGDNVAGLSWSPDSTRVLYISDEKILTSVDLNSVAENVYEEPDWTAFYLSSAVFCDDGRSITFTKSSGDMDMTTYLATTAPDGDIQVLYAQIMMQCHRIVKAGTDKTLLLSRVYQDHYRSGRSDILICELASGAMVPVGCNADQVSNPVYIPYSLDEISVR